MKLNQWVMISSLAFAFSAGWAQAQDAGDEVAEAGELTIALIPDPEADLPEAVTRTITLPDSAAEEGIGNSPTALETANEARGRAQDGLNTAADALEQGREFSIEMADAARENRENFVRGDDELDLADLVPDMPDTPDVPEIPDVPTPPQP